MLFRFKPPRDAEHSHPLEDCVSWWRDRRDNLLAYARLKAQTDLDAEDLLAESVKRIVRAVAIRSRSNSIWNREPTPTKRTGAASSPCIMLSGSRENLKS